MEIRRQLEVSFICINEGMGYLTIDILCSGVNSAILRYDGAPASDPNSTAVANPVQLNEADVVVSSMLLRTHLGILGNDFFRISL